MVQSKMPLFDALLKWKRMNPLSFHVPGHKNGKIFPEKARPLYETILSIDATEIDGLDDLHEPEGAIFQAQQLLSQLYGSKESYFLVGGTTAGNLAMILATCVEQEFVLVQRNSHKSIMNGLEMANVKPVFLTPIVDESTNVAVGVSLDIVKEAYAAYPEAKVLIVTNPNYYGMTMDLQATIEFAHERGMVVLVDEAHGAHFGIGEPFPNSAVSVGADVVVQSAHKTLPAMTMGSFIHVNEGYPYREKLKNYLAMLQSSSPSYPIMASLDVARFYIAQLRESDLQVMNESIEQFRLSLEDIDSIRLVTEQSSKYKQDPLKVIVQSKCGKSGFELQKLLERHAIFPELADEVNVLLVMPLAPVMNGEHTVLKMTKALTKDPIEQDKKNVSVKNMFEFERSYRSLSLSYKEMAKAQKKYIPLHEAERKVAAEPIIPYPPGIPLIMKGEVILRKDIEMLDRLLAKGARIQGGSKLNEKQLLIFDDRGE